MKNVTSLDTAACFGYYKVNWVVNIYGDDAEVLVIPFLGTRRDPAE